MKTKRIQSRLVAMQADYERVTGASFADFMCPILRVEEPVGLCEGHIIPDAFKTCSTWIPQRKDVDNFFGSVTEADFIDVIQHRGKSAFEKWLDPNLRKRFRPIIKIDGQTIDHYFPQSNEIVSGYTPGTLVANGKRISNLVIKESQERLKSLQGTDMRIVIDQDCRAAVVASILKAAHLTLFHLLGYNHVYSAGGMYISDILRDFFYLNNGIAKRHLGESLTGHFSPFARMISPMLVKDRSVLRGTVLDNRVIGCFGGTEGIFSVGIVVPAAEDLFCVFLPSGYAYTIDTYPSFLNDPPQSFAAKLIEFVPSNGNMESHWRVGKEEPIRIPMPDRLPPA